ncbi:MAG TPA: SLBB domain-containing protein [Gemmatimonadaceae bacterium]|jgi:protein involved in polysaccharide export with SLBB domain|nr:SLBB domain-containing protein [Gemmatimonadaceae bacterium]
MISTLLLRAFALAGVLSVISSDMAPAQVLPSTLPSPAQAQQLLENNPALGARIQQMVQSSGLTPDQIRERLRAQGYPDTLLDQYLGSAKVDSTLVPGDQVFAAMRALGIGDSTEIKSLTTRARSQRHNPADSIAFLDTLQRALQNDTIADAIRTVLRSRSDRLQLADSGNKIFGLDLFSGATTQFDANAGGAADPNYRFGPGDQFFLILTGDVEKAYQLRVTPGGVVVIPDVGAVNVAGQTRAQLEDALFTRLSRVYSGVKRGPGATTHFYIEVSQIGANQVFVTGDVEHPSSYSVSRAGTAMTALYQAGGPTPNGSMRAIAVMRNGEKVATLDVYDYALHGNTSKDIRLENGDLVFVPPRGPQVRVAGAVLRPATYELLGNQTVADVIQLAGGFRASADERRVQIERVVPPAERGTPGTDRRVVDVAADFFPTAQVRAGDVIRVLEVARRVADRIVINGNVWVPGAVAFTPGMHLSDALHLAGGLKPDSYLASVLVTRLQADSTRTMYRTAVFDTTGRAVNDLALEDADEITVFSTTDFRPQRTITVGGAVKKTAIIPYRDGMTLRDAILLAGGLQEGALLTFAEVARLPESRAAGVTATTQLVAIDSTYLFERGSGNDRYLGPPGIPGTVGRAPEFKLQPYDAVLIRRQPEWQLQQTVNVQGEVLFPGPYSITSKTEHLTDVIKRAGGLTSAADPNGVVFIRKRGDIGRVGVDLPSILRDSSYIDNLQVVDGDSVFIPKYTPVVAVRGAVNSVVGVPYVRGANLDYYIRSAGGETAMGDGGRAYVTQPNGKVEARQRHLLLFHTQPHPQPGSTVVVPEKDPNDRRDWASIAAASTSILGSLVAIAALVRR